MAVDFGTLVFVVVVIGGLGSVVGALIASLMIGLFISFSVGLNVSIADLLGLVGLGPWAHELGGLFTLQLSTIANSMPFLLMLLVLLDPSGRPDGGSPVIKTRTIVLLLAALGCSSSCRCSCRPTCSMPRSR